MGICLPQHDPGTFDALVVLVLHMAENANMAPTEDFVAKWLIQQGLQKLKGVFKGMCVVLSFYIGFVSESCLFNPSIFCPGVGEGCTGTAGCIIMHYW